MIPKISGILKRKDPTQKWVYSLKMVFSLPKIINMFKKKK